MFGRAHSEEGFTLTELLVVITLMGFVLGAAYSLMDIARRGSDLSNREAWTSREIGTPLLEMDRILSQQVPPLQQVGPYSIQVRTDRDRNFHYEYYTFTANANGTLSQVVVGGNAAGTSAWSFDNRNLSTSTPLFTYYDIDGNDITSAGQDTIKQYAASIRVTVVAEHDGRQFTDSRQVFFRNR
jgi:prepilin-type N-terminal cleavage/methylation domain-containing protein